MSRLSDYLVDVFITGFADQDVERLLEGSTPCNTEFVDVADFVDVLRTYRTVAPTNEATVSVAILAATAAESAHRPALTDPKTQVPRPDRRPLLSRRLAVATTAFILLVGMSGIAVAADGAAPGDFLYPIDRALEHVGIGNGSADERIREAEHLLDHGQVDAAFAHLQHSLIESEIDLDEAAIRKIERHLDLADTKANPSAAAAQDRVAEKKQFIEENKGQGNGLDGKEFGQEVSEIPKERGTGSSGEVGPPEHAGPKESKGKAPENAGPKDKGKPSK